MLFCCCCVDVVIFAVDFLRSVGSVSVVLLLVVVVFTVADALREKSNNDGKIYNISNKNVTHNNSLETMTSGSFKTK